MTANTNVKNRLCKTLYRPAGYQCDEYPFRSTYEGGWFSSLSPAGLANQFSVKMVDATQNGLAGNELLNQYNSQVLTNGEAFFMWVH